MKKKLFAVCAVIVATILVFSGSSVSAADPIKLKTAWMPESESFLPWIAKQKGWDKEEGLDLEMVFFDSGAAMMEALPAKQWVLGGTGGVPQVVGALRHGAYMIGLACDSSITNNVYVRADSPIMKSKGFNKNFPDVFGSPNDVKGKTVLVTTVSSVHYALANWLKVLGLKETDVIIKQMDQASVVAAFEKGIGDVACIWAPYSYAADRKGWKEAFNLKMAGVALTITLVGDKEFCDKNPEIVAKFLRVYLRGVNWYRKNGPTPEMVKLYQKFMKDWGGENMSEAECKMDLEYNPVWTLEEQLQFFDASKGESTAARWQRQVAEFFTEQGRFKPAELEKVNKLGYVTDKFLKLVKTPVPTDSF
jgi:ABC-type nitrate/sulfonate/bicarbonate transport system substrate-binding protein